MRLFIKLKNGKIIKGENELDHNKEISRIGISEIYLKPKVKADEKAVEKIKNADWIIIGPGDYYGSIVPNLLVDGISAAILKSKAKVIFNCNMTNKKGQTENFDLNKYVQETNKYIGKKRINFATFNIKKPAKQLIEKYEKQEGPGMMVELDDGKKINRKYEIIKADLLSEKKVKKKKAMPFHKRGLSSGTTAKSWRKF